MKNNPIEELRDLKAPVSEQEWESIVHDKRYVKKFGRKTGLSPKGRAALIIGAYDGFYGPGTGTFLIIAFTGFAKMSVRSANAHAKVINMTTNVTSLVVFLHSGQVLIVLGLAGAACCMLGNYIGSGLVLTKGTRIVRPVILVVLVLLFAKILFGF